MDDDENIASSGWRFVPNPWKLSDIRPEMLLAPSHATKRAARLAVQTSEVQQATGWLLLTHFGILLGAFGPMMSGKVFWLSWTIFILEALSKWGRSYIHNYCFRDVPCAYVPAHRKYMAFAFGLYAQLGAAVAEACLYVPSWIQFIRQYRQFRINGCGSDWSNADCTSRQRMDEVLLAACVITLLHIFCGMVATASLLRAVMSRPQEKLACLTWWVHLSRHGQMSVAVGSGQPDICGLPVHWLAGEKSLWKFLEDSFPTAPKQYIAVPASVQDSRKCNQLMAMRGLLSLLREKQQQEHLRNTRFDHVLKVLREGSSSECSGLAAAIIGVWASQIIEVWASEQSANNTQLDNFSKAIYPLKWLLTVTGAAEEECGERVLGCLLNIALLPDEDCVMKNLLLSDDESMGRSRLPMFTDVLIQQARIGPTCRVRVLAISLLIWLSMKSSAVCKIILEHKLLFADLVERGWPLELRAVAAGLLWELAYSSKAQKPSESSELKICLAALVKSLAEIASQALHPDLEAQNLARNAAGALASFAYKNKVVKDMITSFEDAIPSLVRVLHEDQESHVQVQACRMLWILADNYPENQARIAAAGAIPQLARLLSRCLLHPEDLLLQVVWAISRLAFKCKANQEAMAPPNELRIIPCLVSLPKLKGEEEASLGSSLAEVVCEKTALALRDLAHDNEANQKTIATQDGALEGLIALMTRSYQSGKRRSKVCALASSAVKLLAKSIHNSNLLGLQEARNRLEQVLRVQPPLPTDVQNAVQGALNALH